MADLHINWSSFQSVPQKFPTLDSRIAFSSPLVNFAQGLPPKHFSPSAHSSPLGQGVLVEQSTACSDQETPQKFVFIVGDLEGKGVVGDSEGEDVVGEKNNAAIGDIVAIVVVVVVVVVAAVVVVVVTGGGLQSKF